MSKFKVWQSTITTRWHWNLTSRNGRIICSGQSVGYASKQGADKGIRAVVRAAQERG